MSFEPLGKVVEENYRASLVLSFALPLAVSVVALRNGPEGAKMTDLERGVRLVFGELSFAALAVASLIETLVRGIFLIPGLILGSINPHDLEEYTPQIVQAIVFGPIACATNAIVCLAALVENIRQNKLVYDEIYPCAMEYARGADKVVRHGFAVGKWLA
jgi:hypothetical protein